MDEFLESIKKEVDLLTTRINQKKMIIVLASTLEDSKYDYSAVLNFHVIINSCIQLGNYRRVCRFIVLVKKVMNDIEKNEKKYIEQLTNYIVTE